VGSLISTPPVLIRSGSVLASIIEGKVGQQFGEFAETKKKYNIKAGRKKGKK